MKQSSTPPPHRHTVAAPASIMAEPIMVQRFRNAVFEQMKPQHCSRSECVCWDIKWKLHIRRAHQKIRTLSCDCSGMCYFLGLALAIISISYWDRMLCFLLPRATSSRLIPAGQPLSREHWTRGSWAGALGLTPPGQAWAGDADQLLLGPVLTS